MNTHQSNAKNTNLSSDNYIASAWEPVGYNKSSSNVGATSMSIMIGLISFSLGLPAGASLVISSAHALWSGHREILLPFDIKITSVIIITSGIVWFFLTPYLVKLEPK